MKSIEQIREWWVRAHLAATVFLMFPASVLCWSGHLAIGVALAIVGGGWVVRCEVRIYKIDKLRSRIERGRAQRYGYELGRHDTLRKWERSLAEDVAVDVEVPPDGEWN